MILQPGLSLFWRGGRRGGGRGGGGGGGGRKMGKDERHVDITTEYEVEYRSNNLVTSTAFPNLFLEKVSENDWAAEWVAAPRGWEPLSDDELSMSTFLSGGYQSDKHLTMYVLEQTDRHVDFIGGKKNLKIRFCTPKLPVSLCLRSSDRFAPFLDLATLLL